MFSFPFCLATTPNSIGSDITAKPKDAHLIYSLYYSYTFYIKKKILLTSTNQYAIMCKLLLLKKLLAIYFIGIYK